MALEILYRELSKDFRVTDDGRLFRLMKEGSWEEVIIKNNTGEGKSGGYCRVVWRCQIYKSHRLMWCLYHECDVDVKLKVDHRDGVKLNNSRENLILDTQRDNCKNKKINRDGKLVGCTFDKEKGKWKAQIRINKKQINLGLFDTEIEAHERYVKACKLIEQYVDNKQFKKLLNDGELTV